MYMIKIQVRIQIYMVDEKNKKKRRNSFDKAEIVQYNKCIKHKMDTPHKGKFKMYKSYWTNKEHKDTFPPGIWAFFV